jgi:hypothetical protein
MILHQDPFVAVDHSGLSEDQISRMISINSYQPSGGWDFDAKASKPTTARTSSTYFDMSDQFRDVRETILDTVFNNWGHRHRLNQCELLQLTMYQPGQQYVPHWDYFNVPGVKADTANDRVATAIVYLNDDFQGGTTSFNQLGLTVTPKKANLLYFYYPPGATAHLSMHSGDVVTSGEKRILTMWIRQY